MAIQSGFGFGMTAGAAGGAVAGFIQNAGMTWIAGGSFGDGIQSGVFGAAIGGISAGIIEGGVQGFKAVANGNNFFTGTAVNRIQESFPIESDIVNQQSGVSNQRNVLAKNTNTYLTTDFLGKQVKRICKKEI